jgi:hypothetical protein
MKKKLIAGLVAASALIAMPTTPAFAEATYVVDGTKWQINDTDDFGIEQFSYFENTETASNCFLITRRTRVAT